MHTHSLQSLSLSLSLPLPPSLSPTVGLLVRCVCVCVYVCVCAGRGSKIPGHTYIHILTSSFSPGGVGEVLRGGGGFLRFATQKAQK